MENEIILYHSDELAKQIEVRIDEENETVWLNRLQMADLFGRDVKTIGKHIANALKEELQDNSVVAKFATTAADGKKYQTEHYNLDMIISVGYRVKSKQGTQFRIWATRVLKDYLLKGYTLNQRMNRIENSVENITNKVQEIEFIIKSNELPLQGIFFDGQVFDAYSFTADLIRRAKKSLILIDNYVDETVLILFTKRKKGVLFSCYTKRISNTLQLDIEKHNDQYPPIQVREWNGSHDRFLIVDKKELYHFGASLKDLGKKWFAFSKMDSFVNDVLQKLERSQE